VVTWTTLHDIQYIDYTSYYIEQKYYTVNEAPWYTRLGGIRDTSVSLEKTQNIYIEIYMKKKTNKMMVRKNIALKSHTNHYKRCWLWNNFMIRLLCYRLREELGWCFVNKTLRLRRFWTAAPVFEDSRERLVFMLINVDSTSGECYDLQMIIIRDTMIHWF